MKYIKQFSIILLISFLGEALHALLPLPIPAGGDRGGHGGIGLSDAVSCEKGEEKWVRCW